MKSFGYLLAIAILGWAFWSCGSTAEEPAGGTVAANRSAAELPNRLVFHSSKIDDAGFQLSHVEAVKHQMRSAGRAYSAMIVHLANYDRGGGSYHPNPKQAGQRRVTLNFSAPEGQALKAGPYQVGGRMAVDYALSIGIEDQANQVGLSNGSGTAEIVHLDDGSLSAKLNLQDAQGTVVEGAFSTSYTKSAY